MKKKIALFAGLAALLVLCIVYLNTYSLVLWKNGFGSSNVYERISLRNASATDYFVLAASGKRYGILHLEKDRLGIWHNNGKSIIFDSHSPGSAAVIFEHDIIPLSLKTTDFFFTGILDQNGLKKLYALESAKGFTADPYQLGEDRYLVLFHLTSNNSAAAQKTAAYIQSSLDFLGM